MSILENELEKLRSKLRFKVQDHIGRFCPDIDDVVQETMHRLLQAEQHGLIRSPKAWAAFASTTCNNVTYEYRRRLWRDGTQDSNTASHDLFEGMLQHKDSKVLSDLSQVSRIKRPG